MLLSFTGFCSHWSSPDSFLQRFPFIGATFRRDVDATSPAQPPVLCRCRVDSCKTNWSCAITNLFGDCRLFCFRVFQWPRQIRRQYVSLPTCFSPNAITFTNDSSHQKTREGRQPPDLSPFQLHFFTMGLRAPLQHSIVARLIDIHRLTMLNPPPTP